MDPNSQQSDFPGVLFAYDFVVPSYDVAHARLSAAEERVQSLVAFAGTLTVAVPAVTRVAIGEIEILTLPSFLAGLCFLSLVVVGLWARVTSKVMVLDPKVVRQYHTDLSEWEFKDTMLYWAGEHHQVNCDLIETAARQFGFMTLLFALEVVLLAWWVVTV